MCELDTNTMNTESNEPRKYNRYDENFKRSAVELLFHGGKSVATIATELGISTQSLKQWKKQLAAFPREFHFSVYFCRICRPSALYL